jgi:hypothetical protein
MGPIVVNNEAQALRRLGNVRNNGPEILEIRHSITGDNMLLD